MVSGGSLYRWLALAVSLACASALPAQTPRDAGSIARDLATPASPREAAAGVNVALPTTQGISDVSTASEGVTIGAVRVEGAQGVAHDAFAGVVAEYLGKQASTQELRSLAKAVASVARERGYVFATAIVPQQTVEAGVVTVQVDTGDLAAVRINGSSSMRLQRTLNLIVGRGVRREVLERQLLLAGDIPGIEVLSTRLVREDIGNVLIVDVRESRTSWSAGIDNHGPSDLGPVRARLRYDFAGIADEADVLSVQAVMTPLDPRQLAYVSARYAANIGTGGTQVAVSGALGRAAPTGSGFVSRSTSVAVSIATPLKRAVNTSVWANAELSALRVDGTTAGVPDQGDSMVVASGWLYATTRLGNGRLSGALGLARGLDIRGTTASGDPQASRADASGVFTKGFFWADWLQPLGRQFSLKLAANGQLADRPLLAAQEIGLGGPGYGRAFDFSERFGDSGFMASAELRWRRGDPVRWIDWIEPYAYVDGGRVWNLGTGFGGGDLISAGGGMRASIGKFLFSVEAAVPVDSTRAATGDRSPRVNLSINRRY